MTELDKVMLTSGLTIIGGCLIFVVQRFLLEPLSEQSRVLGKITFAMHYYGREYSFPINPDHADAGNQQRYWTVADRLRELGSSLAEASQGIRFYWFWEAVRMAPRRKRVDQSIALLTRMSNSMFAFDTARRSEQTKQNCLDADEVTKLLGLRRWGK